MKKNFRLVALLLAALGLASCLPKAGPAKSSIPDAKFFEDYDILEPSDKVHRAWVNPDVDLRKYQSLRIPDFENHSGVQLSPPSTVALAAEILAEELYKYPPSVRAFEFIDRSPVTTTSHVDLLLEGAITRYDVRADTPGDMRLNEQIRVGIECRLVEPDTRRVVVLIQHKVSQKRSYVGYANPVRQAFEEISKDVAAFLVEPDVNQKKKDKKKKKKDKDDDEEEDEED